jgi:hypothetical protein
MNFYDLFEKDDYDELLRSLLKLNVFLNTNLETDMLCLIFNKNINVRADTEDKLINFYNQCLVLDQGRTSNSKEKTTKKMSIFTYIDIKIIITMKMKLFETRKKIFENNFLMNWDSLNNSLVNQSALEYNLEDYLKVVILDLGYSKEELVYKIDNRLYFKFKCCVKDSRIDFKDFNTNVTLFSPRLSVLHSVEAEADNIIKMNYKSITICVVLPTKIERNIWLYSIKNLKHSKTNFVEEANYAPINEELFLFNLKNSKINLKNFQVTIEKPFKIWEFSLVERTNIHRIKQMKTAELDSDHEEECSRRSTIDFGDLDEDDDEEEENPQSILQETQHEGEKQPTESPIEHDNLEDVSDDFLKPSENNQQDNSKQNYSDQNTNNDLFDNRNSDSNDNNQFMAKLNEQSNFTLQCNSKMKFDDIDIKYNEDFSEKTAKNTITEYSEDQNYHNMIFENEPNMDSLVVEDKIPQAQIVECANGVRKFLNDVKK